MNRGQAIREISDGLGIGYDKQLGVLVRQRSPSGKEVKWNPVASPNPYYEAFWEGLVTSRMRDSLSVPDTAAQGTKCPTCGSNDADLRLCTCSPGTEPHGTGNPAYLCSDKWHESLPDTGTLPAPNLVSKLNDLVSAMRTHSNEHLHSVNASIRGQAAIEGVCADRIEEILKAWTLPAEGLLVEALERIAAKQCSCMSSSDPDWHHETCFKFIANLALSTYKQGKRTT